MTLRPLLALLLPAAVLIAALAALAAVPAAHAADAFVLASFTQPANAEIAADRARAVLGVPVAIVESQVNGNRYLRVLTPAQPGDLLDRIKRAGFTGVWIWWRTAPGQEAFAETVPVSRDRTIWPPAQVVRPDPQQPIDRPGIDRPKPDRPGPDQPVTGRPAPAAPMVSDRAAPTPTPPKAIGSAPAAPTATGETMRLVVADTGAPIQIRKFNQADITIDGRLDESIWSQTPAYDNLTVIEPDTLAKPRHQTAARFLYTDRGLYIGVKNHQPPETLIARLSSRDEFINRDSWGITLDTSGEGLYGYWFTVNLGGSIEDGKVAPEREYSREWDGPWTSATQELPDGWSLEMFLPWSMMTMPAGVASGGDRAMGFWVERKVAYVDERWSWPALPFTGARFMSALKPMALPGVSPKQQVAAFPYVSSTYDNDDAVQEFDYRAGVDLFWRPTSSLQLTAAIFPDFGAVESDDVVINLTSRETFFPEKRLFFLEGNEVFITSPRGQIDDRSSSSGSNSGGARRTAATFTATPTTLVNTRRIGGASSIEAPDDVTVAGFEQSRPTELLGAVKVTGQTGPLRYGLLGAFEDDPRIFGTRDSDGTRIGIDGAGRNFGVARVLYESVGRGRRAIGYVGTVVDHPDARAVTHGIDGHFLSAGGRVRGDIQLAASDVDGAEDGYGGWADFSYTPRRGVRHQAAFDYQDRNLDISDFGFIRRNDFIGGRYALSLTKSTGMKWFRNRTTSFSAGHWVNGEGRNTRSGLFLRNSWTFNHRGEVRTALNFFPERWEDLESRGNGSYKIQNRWYFEVAYGSDTSRKLSWSTQLATTQEDLDDWSYVAALGATFKPIDRFSLDFDLNYRYRKDWLLYQEDRNFTTFEARDLQPKLSMDLFLTARQQLRLTLQWAGIQAKEQDFYEVPLGDGWLLPVTKAADAATDNFTISRLTAQFRYRWEIAPLSDLFVVYTRGSNVDNRIDEEFGELFSDAVSNPLIDVLILKLRYRFGS